MFPGQLRGSFRWPINGGEIVLQILSEMSNHGSPGVDLNCYQMLCDISDFATYQLIADPLQQPQRAACLSFPAQIHRRGPRTPPIVLLDGLLDNGQAIK